MFCESESVIASNWFLRLKRESNDNFARKIKLSESPRIQESASDFPKFCWPCLEMWQSCEEDFNLCDFCYQKSTLWTRVAFLFVISISPDSGKTCVRQNTQSWCILVDSSTYILKVLSFDPFWFFIFKFHVIRKKQCFAFPLNILFWKYWVILIVLCFRL